MLKDSQPRVTLRGLFVFFLGFAIGAVTMLWQGGSLGLSGRLSPYMPDGFVERTKEKGGERLELTAGTCGGERITQGRLKTPQNVQETAPPFKPSLKSVTSSTSSGSKGLPLQRPEVAVVQRFLTRRQVLQKSCHAFDRERKIKTRHFVGRFFVVEPDKALYCPIEKTGSTEWIRFLREMSERNVSVRPLGGTQKNFPAYSASFRVRFLFVREPYLRLVSGYVDKLLSPNVVFWSLIGKHIVSHFRANPTKLSLECGHDVTFAEFIDYVIDAERTGRKADGHFTPQYKHCYPCDVPYTHVGNLETMSEDRQIILDAIDSPVNYTGDFAFNSLRNMAHWYISSREKYKKCITVDNALRRLWQKLKIRGFLSAEAEFPLAPGEAEKISPEKFIALASKAMERSEAENPNLLKDNRRLALIEAYNSVSMEKKEALEKLFSWDFKLFGYDSHPEEVFSKTNKNAKASRKTTLFSLT